MFKHFCLTSAAQPGCDVDLSVISVLEHDIEHLRNSEINWVYSKKCNSQLLTAHFFEAY